LIQIPDWLPETIKKTEGGLLRDPQLGALSKKKPSIRKEDYSPAPRDQDPLLESLTKKKPCPAWRGTTVFFLRRQEV